VAADLDGAMAALRETADATYSVAWIDCLARGASLGRSLIYAAEHATRDEVAGLRPGAELFPLPRRGRLTVPLDLPAVTLNRASVKAFNEVYFRRGARNAGEPSLVHWDPYFFPLDGIGDWNRIYGRRGFVQYQCVVPSAAAREVLGDIVERISARGNASFLAVLKQLGPSTGTLSFPLEGFTLALDLPVTDDLFPLLDDLDRSVVAARGRLYLAKDARQSRATFEASYPGLPAFRELRRNLGADGHIVSRLSSRLGI
jgi:FAD/FMN-containing dehydrogenase